MFEHSSIDGNASRIVPANLPAVSAELLELREAVAGKDLSGMTRRQFGVIGDYLVERSLPPESIGDRWSYDAVDVPWWVVVKHPPHAGLVADFNEHFGGKYRIPLDPKHNVVGFTSSGEEILFTNGQYTVKRGKDGKEIAAGGLVELRKLYFSDL